MLQRKLINFEPPLEPQRVAAIDSFTMSFGCKVHLVFSDSVSPPDCHGIVASDDFLPEFWFNKPDGIGGLCNNDGCWHPEEAPADIKEEFKTVGCSTSGWHLATGFAMGDNATSVSSSTAVLIRQAVGITCRALADFRVARGGCD